MRRVWLFCLLSLACHGAVASAVVRIGSKTFTESYILAELAAQTAERLGLKVERHMGMGGTGILYQALTTGAIDLYPEYTGTIAEAIIKRPGLSDWGDLQKALAPLGLTISKPLGFNNTYALAVSRPYAEKNHLSKISDLAKLPAPPRIAFSHEFISRDDGVPRLRKIYGINFTDVHAMEHSLAYEAIAAGKVDLIDVYSTDAKVAKLDLVVLKDDRDAFPVYEAVWLARKSLAESAPQYWQALEGFAGRISAKDMRERNEQVDIDGMSFAAVAHAWLPELGVAVAANAPVQAARGPSLWHRMWERLSEHLWLVGVSLALALIIGLPFGVLAAHTRTVGQVVLAASGLVQTIPSLALLCFLIPWLGIGTKPALAALFLYSLLPILVNMVVGIRGIDPVLQETARALGLNFWQRLWRVELPLASPVILAGIKTATILIISTTTIAALIGAGGLGVLIVSGLAINDLTLILWGAIPSALLALVAWGLFEFIEWLLIPEGMK